MKVGTEGAAKAPWVQFLAEYALNKSNVGEKEWNSRRTRATKKVHKTKKGNWYGRPSNANSKASSLQSLHMTLKPYSRGGRKGGGEEGGGYGRGKGIVVHSRPKVALPKR